MSFGSKVLALLLVLFVEAVSDHPTDVVAGEFNGQIVRQSAIEMQVSVDGEVSQTSPTNVRENSFLAVKETKKLNSSCGKKEEPVAPTEAPPAKSAVNPAVAHTSDEKQTLIKTMVFSTFTYNVAHESLEDKPKARDCIAATEKAGGKEELKGRGFCLRNEMAEILFSIAGGVHFLGFQEDRKIVTSNIRTIRERLSEDKNFSLQDFLKEYLVPLNSFLKDEERHEEHSNYRAERWDTVVYENLRRNIMYYECHPGGPGTGDAIASCYNTEKLKSLEFYRMAHFLPSADAKKRDRPHSAEVFEIKKSKKKILVINAHGPHVSAAQNKGTPFPTSAFNKFFTFDRLSKLLPNSYGLKNGNKADISMVVLQGDFNRRIMSGQLQITLPNKKTVKFTSAVVIAEKSHEPDSYLGFDSFTRKHAGLDTINDQVTVKSPKYSSIDNILFWSSDQDFLKRGATEEQSPKCEHCYKRIKNNLVNVAVYRQKPIGPASDHLAFRAEFSSSTFDKIH